MLAWPAIKMIEFVVACNGSADQHSNLHHKKTKKGAQGSGNDPRVGIGILKGVVVSWESRKFKNLIFREYLEGTWIKKKTKFDLPKL